MSFFSNLGSNISNKSKEVAKKAKDMADIANLNGQINGQEKVIDRTYSEIGKMYYANNSDDMNTPYEEKMSAIRAAMEQIEKLKASIEQIKQSDNDDNKPEETSENVQEAVTPENTKEEAENDHISSKEVICPNCKAQISADTKFCPSCGQNLTLIQQTEENVDKKRCPSCNKEVNSLEQSFCDACGSKL